MLGYLPYSDSIRTKLSPPWVTYMNMIEALFDPDPAIAINKTWDENPTITLAVSGSKPEKAVAIRKLLPESETFGNIKLLINVDCPVVVNIAFKSDKELFDAAFEGSAAFTQCVCPSSEGYYFPDMMTYVIFKNCVVQYFDDNLKDAHGLVSTLYQDLAAVLFEDSEAIRGVIGYSTDVERGALGKPLGEWP